MAVSNDLIMKLRKMTGAGIMNCKSALMEADGDIEKAKVILREKGILKMQSRKDRISDEGQVYAYVHPGGKMGVLVEIACESDFVARSEDFQKILKETALQIVGMKPDYVKPEEIPSEVIEEEKKVMKSQNDLSKKPPQIVEKILKGKLAKFYESACLMEQPYFREEKNKFKNYFNTAASSFGEAVDITRFVRFEIGK